MRILVTAGNTLTSIDRVRCLTNIFTGRTGAAIALHAWREGHDVCLLTSHPEAVRDLAGEGNLPEAPRWKCLAYRTFEDLQRLMVEEIPVGRYDAVIHGAAVSDYLSAGVYAPAPGTSFDVASATWSEVQGEKPSLLDRAAGKVKSDEPELWLRLVRAPKLVDRIRTDWHFHGVLVKFKLEVGLTEEQLLDIAEKSRRQSTADLMVANTLEGASTWALLGPIALPLLIEGRRVSGEGVISTPSSPLGGGGVGGEVAEASSAYARIFRRDLPGRLLEAIESLHREQTHG